MNERHEEHMVQRSNSALTWRLVSHTQGTFDFCNLLDQTALVLREKIVKKIRGAVRRPGDQKQQRQWCQRRQQQSQQ